MDEMADRLIEIGKISLQTGKNVNCLVYLNFENEFLIFTGVLPTTIPNIGILCRLKNAFNQYPVLKESQNSLGREHEKNRLRKRLMNSRLDS